MKSFLPILKQIAASILVPPQNWITCNLEAALQCNSLFSDFAVIWVNPIYFPVTTNSASMHHIPFILDRSRCWKSVHSDNLDFRTMLEIGWSLCSGCYRGFRKLKFAPKRILWIFLSLPAFIIKVLQALKCTKKGAGNKKEACSRVRDFSQKKKKKKKKKVETSAFFEGVMYKTGSILCKFW